MCFQQGLPRSSVCLGRSSPGPTPPLSFPTSPWPPPWEHRAVESRLLAITNGRRQLKNQKGSGASGTHICGANLHTNFCTQLFTGENYGQAHREYSYREDFGLPCYAPASLQNTTGMTCT